MVIKNVLKAGVASFAMLSIMAPDAFAPAAHAQQITSEIRGVVVDESGSPVSGAQVSVIDTRTGGTRRTTTDATGSFTALNLVVGGPYTVRVTADGFRGAAVENIGTSLGESTTVSVTMTSGDVSGDEIVVTATRSNVAELAIGPNSSFDVQTLEGFPSISRDIRDIIRIDPRVSIDLANEVPRISCLGGNDRTNTFTVDGVIRADVFGLNGTPFAARNTFVLPFDAISQTSVEFAPFDVEYGQFTGCNINVVTRSGSNEVHGSAFFNYSGSGLQGDHLDERPFTVFDYDDFNWGASLGGPIIKDRLFFFAAYEETDDADPQLDGPIGSGFANEGTSNEPSLALVQEIQSILQTVYGRDTLGIAQSLPQSSRRIFGRLDWLINDNHRLELTYDRLRETNVESDDYGFSPVGFTFFDSFEDEGTRSEIYSGRLFSQWTDNFSTEIRVSRADVADQQGPVGGGEAQAENFPTIIVGTGDFTVNNQTNATTVASGPGQFRSANQLNTQVDQLKIKGDYVTGNHTVTLGYELNQLDVFNLFIANATGRLFFQDIDALRTGTLSGGTQLFPNFDQVNDGAAIGAVGNFSLNGDPNNAAATFSRSIHSLYVQDEWEVSPVLDVIAGIRYEFYTGSDAPNENPNFIARYGFSNARDFGDLSIVLPRLGINYNPDWDVRGDLSFRLGAGVFTGGDPTVWFSNAYSNSGGNFGQGATTSAGCTAADLQLNGVLAVPQCAINAGAARAANFLADTQSTDPNLQLASVIRSNFGWTWNTNFSGGQGLFDDWRVDIDYIYSRFRNPYTFVDLSQTIDARQGVNGFTAEGRPIFRAIDPTVANCDAQLVGTGGNNPQFTNVTAACFSTGRDDEIQLTNAEGFGAHSVSAILSKQFEYTSPLWGTDGSLRLNLGYSWTDSQNRRDLTSSQSTSNFDGTALSNRQNPGVGTSGFETRHNLTAAISLQEEFIRDFPTRLGIFFSAASGRPYSFTFAGGGDFNDSASGNNNALFYVPTGINDPLVTGDAATLAAVDALVSGTPCLAGQRGQTFERNSCRNEWFLDLDLRFQQALPVPGKFFEDRLVFFVDVDNFANLLNSNSNIRRIVNSNVSIADVNIDSQGRYNLTNYRPNFNERIDVFASVWSAQFGIRYEF